jgi:PAS domain S-box-containing protein
MTTRLSPQPPAGFLDLNDVLERVSDGIAAFDASHRVTYANAAAGRLLGVDPASLIGRRMLELYPHLEGRFEEALRAVARSGEPATLDDMDHPSGRAFRHSVHPLPDGGVVTYFRDVSARRSAKSALSRSLQRYQTLFESIDEGFCVIEVLFDDDGVANDYRFLEINPSFVRQTGLENAVGRRMRELAPAHEAHWYRIYGDVALTGVPVRFEQRAEALGRWYDVYAFRIDEPEQRRVAVLFNDVSERKRIERALQDSDRRKDEFLAILAHELRNPLAPLRNGLEIMKRAASGDSGLVAQSREMMERQVDHMVALVDDLLDVSRISRGQISVELRRTDLADIAHRAMEAAEPAMRERRHELTLQLPAGATWVNADEVRMTQAVGNLLVNAAKYTPPGGRISLVVRREAHEASVCVSDNGIGIPADMLGRVFELFTQLQQPGHRAAGGLGIGLTIVRQFVALHGGSVEAASDGPGAGSRFTIRLPLLPEAAHADAGPGAAQAPAPRRRRVLVCDDNRDAAQSLSSLLELLGQDVQTAFDGEEAVQAAERHHPDLVLMDIGMPKLDGHAAARRIRARDWAKDVVLVAVTGWGQADDRLTSKASGFDHHLVKPIDMAALGVLLSA